MSAFTLHQPTPFFLAKVEALKARTELLTGLSKVVSTKVHQNISDSQWYAINNQLNVIAGKILRQLELLQNDLLKNAGNEYAHHKGINTLGEIELELSQAYTFYDTYMDILTQRLSPVLGPLLQGCDVIAADGLKHRYLTDVTRNPIVYCDRGFGARILRQGVSLARSVNPVAFIAIPYSRLAEKYNLMSIYHEVGHQALNKLDLVETFQDVFSLAAKKSGASPLLQTMFGNWSRELLPDFWAFAFTGMGQTSSMRDVLLVPRAMAFGVSPSQQHPPPYLRFLASVAWCQFLWGRGAWDEWAEEWEACYPLRKADKLTGELLAQARKCLPAMARATLTTRFKKLGHQPLTSLFDMDNIAPPRLKRCAAKADFQKAPVGVQLAWFRLIRDKKDRPIEHLNKTMHTWLLQLNQDRISKN